MNNKRSSNRSKAPAEQKADTVGNHTVDNQNDPKMTVGLVLRTSTVNRVKQLANEQERSFSQMAQVLLNNALRAHSTSTSTETMTR